MTDTQKLISFGIRGRTKHCPQCNQKYYRLDEWVTYQYDSKTFCSWNCKCAYRKIHPVETHRKNNRTVPSRKPNKRKKIKPVVQEMAPEVVAKTTKTSLINSLLEIDPSLERNFLYTKTKLDLEALLEKARRINTLL